MLLLAGLLVACSNQQIYRAVQDNQRLECSKLPQTQFEQCMAELEWDYEDYIRERDSARGESTR